MKGEKRGKKKSGERGERGGKKKSGGETTLHGGCTVCTCVPVYLCTCVPVCTRLTFKEFVASSKAWSKLPLSIA